MGSVKPTYIKVMGERMLKELGPEYEGSFEDSKIKVTESTNIRSKTVRNRVAGYITRKVNRRNRRGG